MIIKIELDGGLDKFISGANSAAAAVDSMEESIVRQAGIAGLENVAANIRSRSGRLAQSYGYYTSYNGTKWLYIQVTLNGVQYTGFSCKTYLKKQ